MIAARALCVGLCLIGAKAVLVATNGRFAGGAAWQVPFWWTQDVLLAAGLSALLVLGRRVPRLAWVGVAGVVLVNMVLTVVAEEVRAYFSPHDPLPEFDDQWLYVMQDYMKPLAATLALSTLAVLVAGPSLVQRFLGARLAGLARLKRPAVVGLALYGAAGLLAFLEPALSALRIHRNPVVYYASELVNPTGLFDTSASPARPLEQVAALQVAAPLPDEAPLLQPAELAALPPVNVLLVVMESVGANAIEGDNHPFLAAQADRAWIFPAHHTPAPHSASSLEAIHCAEYRLPRSSNGRLLERCAPLPRRLQAAGIATGFFQSTFFGDWIPESFFLAMGYGETHDSRSIARMAAERGQPIQLKAEIAQEVDTADAVRRFIEARCAAGQPWLATWYTWVAHSPYPEAHAGGVPFDPKAPPKVRHRQLVRLLDREIGKLYEHVQHLPCGDRPTVVVVTGDHGEAFFEHPGNQYHTAYPYQENLAVPLYVLLPRQAPPGLAALVGRRGHLPSSHVDLARTLADLTLGRARATAVVEAAPALGGRSLLDATAHRPLFAHSLLGEGMLAARWGPYKLIRSPDVAVLFDLARDPGETRNVLAAHAAVGAALGTALDRHAADLRTRYP